MTQNKVMKLWTVIATAFLALCTALGFVTTTATAAAAEQPAGTAGTAGTARSTTVPVTVPAQIPWTASHSRALPPTMKQRIRAEAHGSSPSCRHRSSADVAPIDFAAPRAAEAPTDRALSAQHAEAPLQR